MKNPDELKAHLATLAQEYKQIKLSSPAKKSLQLVAFTKEEAQEINAKVNKFDGIKDNAQLDALVIKLYNGYPKNIANYRPIENRIKISRANINELRKNPNISQQSGILIIKN